MARVRVFGLSLILLGASLGVMSLAQPLVPAGDLPIVIPWWTLTPAFLLTSFAALHFEVRGEVRTFTLSHLVLAIGLVFVAPWQHLAARALAAVVYAAFVRRQPPHKALFNVVLACTEVATAVSVVTLFAPVHRPGPTLSLALISALLISECVSVLALEALLLTVEARHAHDDIRAVTMNILLSTIVFAGLAVVVVGAAWTDPWTAGFGALVGVALALAYRTHRNLTTDQMRTKELHQFIRALGPLDLELAGSQEVLGQARVLVQARHLDLALHLDGGWCHFVDQVDSAVDLPFVPLSPERATASALGKDDHMSAPLVGAHDLVGVLRVTSHLGEGRTFGLPDLRLLETLAAELSTALERGRLQRELALAATTDALTRLPNLHELTRRLDALLDTGVGLIVAAVAVDSFREVNDTLGHQVGDDLLLEVTSRLTAAYPQALLGRIGGGRFALALPSASEGGDPALFGLGVRSRVEGSAQLGPVGTHIKLSVGCVVGPEHGSEAATLIRRAETAMYGARHASGGPVVWEPVYEVEGQRRLAVVTALREALASGAIGVQFQPKIDIASGRVTGVEALARWSHPALGEISPTEFVPLAEASGLMGRLTSSVLRQALTTCASWNTTNGPIGVAVNVSAETILDPAFATEVAAVLTAVSVPPELLTVELTEGVLVGDPGLAALRLGELRALGIRISVDDFGTGYSSLTYLKGLPVDEVKIDKEFVRGIVHDPADGAVVRAVVDIAHTLGIKVVAEGVERHDQHQVLVGFGVDEVQGFLHARPMSAWDMGQWLSRRDEAPAH